MKQRFLAHLHKQNIELSWQRYGLDALNFMALGLFSTLILGLILKNIGTWLQLAWLMDIGTQAQSMMGAAIGAGVAYGLKAPPLVIFTSCTTGLMGAALGGPIGAFVAAIFGAELGKFVHKTTPIDIILTPMVTLIAGALSAKIISPIIASLMTSLGQSIMWAMDLNPILMSMVVAAIMGVVLTLPISSAAIAITLGLSGITAGAATVGCAAHMIGFAVMSYKDNGIGGSLACGLGTSMIQMPNLLKNPKLWIPPTVTGAILAPFATVIFDMQNIPSGAGMGTSGLVGQIGTIDAMGFSGGVLGLIIAFHFVLPALICFGISAFMRKKGYIAAGDLRIHN